MQFDIFIFIINILLILVIGISAFWIKSLFNDVKENKKELIERKDNCENKFTTQVVCNTIHKQLSETLDEMKRDMKDNFQRLYDKIDVANSIGDGLKEMGKEMGREIGKAIKQG